MNVASLGELRERFIHRLRYRVRHLDPRRRVRSLCATDDSAIRLIYVINLDRRADRWQRQRRELDRFQDRTGRPVSSMTRRFSAVDARYMDSEPDPRILTSSFSLADQLTVAPDPLLIIDDAANAHEITMSRQEIAVALSHIEVWKLLAAGTATNALILEDDVFLPIGFARHLDTTWSELDSNISGDLDLLYLSYRDVGAATTVRNGHAQRRLAPGLWQASGYVLTQQGARKLLAALPMHGPVDLWLNFQFATMNVFQSDRSFIEQNIDEPSTNAYSVLPVLAQLGVITREKPLLHSRSRLQGPVIASGDPGSGLTALATALLMLGYTCCSDVDDLPPSEADALLRRRSRRRMFNAYVNVRSLGPQEVSAIAASNRHAVFITTGAPAPAEVAPARVLKLAPEARDKWAALTDFLQLDYPSFRFPQDPDLGIRIASITPPAIPEVLSAKDREFDRSPWILQATSKSWRGFVSDPAFQRTTTVSRTNWAAGEHLDGAVWRLRDDTFPSNLAWFTPSNFTETAGQHADLTLESRETAVRSFASAAIASRKSHLYGRFRAELKPAAGPGLITGPFLHRNGPRQEIDIEFLGQDTFKMLVNVYFNPGPEGTKLEYGYRGTPTEIDLGFDTAADYHTYEIDWAPNKISWSVDGRVVYERNSWNPTPIPDQPMEFNLNLWHSRSTELAGPLDRAVLPAVVSVRSISVDKYDPIVKDRVS